METEKNGGPNFLRAWRAHREMTLEQLADKVGTTASVISYLEEGKRGLSAKWLRRLAPALKTTPGHLLERHPDDLGSDIYDIWQSISERDRDQARKVLETFRKAG